MTVVNEVTHFFVREGTFPVNFMNFSVFIEIVVL